MGGVAPDGQCCVLRVSGATRRGREVQSERATSEWRQRSTVDLAATRRQPELSCIAMEGEPIASVERHGGCSVVGDGYGARRRNLAAGYAAEVVRRY
jgi:hypothetical protein